MRKSTVLVILLLVVGGENLSAKSCSDYEAAFDIAQYTMKEQGRISYRKSYDLVNTLIDTATEYLGYCQKEITLADQYQIKQVIKRADKNRRRYFKGAVREYHAIYGIRPNVTEIYQDGSVSIGGGSGANVWSKTSAPISANTWTHLTATWDTGSDNYTVYINGILTTPTATTVAGNPVGINQVNIGSNLGNFPTHGIFDDLMIFDRGWWFGDY